MARHKTQEFKQFAIAKRRSVGSTLSAAPVWTFQKANRRLFSKTSKRTWKQIGIGKLFDEQQHTKETQAIKHMKRSFLVKKRARLNKKIKSKKKTN
ncbi:MAG: hypothetical protein Q7S92_00990 [Candidatus Diapherotrites archaeon]|nr:hypothetical protein [Candidatus Diapherotrites archaeon]